MSVYIGIDLGTTNSSIAYVVATSPDKQVSSRDVNNVGFQSPDGKVDTARLPSVIALEPHQNNKSFLGNILGWAVIDALKRVMGKKSGLKYRNGRELLRSFKSDMGTHKIYHASLIDDVDTPRDAAAKILAELLNALEEQIRPEDPRQCPVVITVPASFSELARQETREAATMAGLANVSLIDEPVAALIDCLNSPKGELWLQDGEPKNILVYDYGGGTCDLSLVQAQRDPAETTGIKVTNLAISNYLLLGGDDIDRAVMKEIVWPQLIEKHPRLLSIDEVPERERQEIEDLLTFSVARELKERMCARLARQGRDRARGDDWATSILVPGDLSVVLDDARVVFLAGASLRALHFRMDEADFRQVMRPFLHDPFGEWAGLSDHSLLKPVYEVLRKAGLESSALHFIVLHGGASKNPLVEEALVGLQGSQPNLFGDLKVVSSPNLDTSVARGAALESFFRHARNHMYVRPIMPEDLGVVAKDNRRVTIISAGTPVPYPEFGAEEVETKFFIQQDGQRELLIPVFVGKHEHLAAVIRLSDLPKGLRAGDPVRLIYSIDSSKQTHWHVRIGDHEPRAAETLASPWSLHAATGAQRRLQKLRARMRGMLDAGEAIDSKLQTEEIVEMQQAATTLKDHEDLLRRIEEFCDEFGPNAVVLNRKAMSFNSRDEHARAVTAGREALELAPSDDYLTANLGLYLYWDGRREEALPYLTRAASTRSYVAYELAALLMARGDAAESKRVAKHGLELARADCARWPDAAYHRFRVAELAGFLGLTDEKREAEAQGRRLQLNDHLGGDSRAQIASEDSGVIWRSSLNAGLDEDANDVEVFEDDAKDADEGDAPNWDGEEWTDDEEDNEEEEADDEEDAEGGEEKELDVEELSDFEGEAPAEGDSESEADEEDENDGDKEIPF